jgi:hypothetical protein
MRVLIRELPRSAFTAKLPAFSHLLATFGTETHGLSPKKIVLKLSSPVSQAKCPPEGIQFGRLSISPICAKETNRGPVLSG